MGNRRSKKHADWMTNVVVSLVLCGDRAQVNFKDTRKLPDLSAVQVDEYSTYVAEDTSFEGFQGEVGAHGRTTLHISCFLPRTTWRSAADAHCIEKRFCL